MKSDTKTKEMNEDGTLFWTIVDIYETEKQRFYVCKVKEALYELPFNLNEENKVFKLGDQCLNEDGTCFKIYFKVEQCMAYRRI